MLEREFLITKYNTYYLLCLVRKNDTAIGKPQIIGSELICMIKYGFSSIIIN